MRVLLTSLGSDGDHFPYIGLGVALRDRGHSVTLVASAHYESLARDHFLDFVPLVSKAEHDELFGNPDFWNPRKAARLGARWGVRFLERQYVLLARLAHEDRALLIANPAVYSAKVVHELLGCPLANLVLQPWIIPTVQAPPVMPHFDLARWPKSAVRGFWNALDCLGYVLVGRHLNRLRARLGLPSVRRMFRTWFSPQLVLAMFPDWFGPPQNDWPPAVRLVGFPRFDGGKMRKLPELIEAFCHAGPPAIAITFGTEIRHRADLYKASVLACMERGFRAVVITQHAQQLPPMLPSGVIRCDFVPFQHLFPLCAAVIHHGGIGTVGTALAAGLPQVILPISFDQMDNAARVRRLGAGATVLARRARPESIESAVKRALEPEVRESCLVIQRRLAGEADPFLAAAQLIEELDAHRSSS